MVIRSAFVHRATDMSPRDFLEREWAKVLLVGAEERPLSGLFLRWLFPVFKAVTLVAGLDNIAMMGQSIQQGGGHLGIAKHLRPLAKAQVGGHDHGCLLVQPAQQMEQSRPAVFGKRQIAQFIEHHAVHSAQL